MVEWPGEAMPAGYVASAEGAIGRGVITPVRLNEPLMDTKLATKEAGGGLPIAVGEGMRAVSVRVNEVVSVAGFVVPGTRVDVLLTLSNAPGTSETTTKVILQNVQTLAAGQQIQKDKDGKPISVTVMTFLLTPEQAETLTLASNQGQIQLALRNTLDTLTTKTEGAVVSGLLGKTKKAAPAARANRGPRAPVQAPAATIIEGYNGGVRTLLKF
ncbi:MAG: Flp pilus assembly protein CpaB, partial [Gemmatimonadales bacterium]